MDRFFVTYRVAGQRGWADTVCVYGGSASEAARAAIERAVGDANVWVARYGGDRLEASDVALVGVVAA